MSECDELIKINDDEYKLTSMRANKDESVFKYIIENDNAHDIMIKKENKHEYHIRGVVYSRISFLLMTFSDDLCLSYIIKYMDADAKKEYDIDTLVIAILYNKAQTFLHMCNILIDIKCTDIFKSDSYYLLYESVTHSGNIEIFEFLYYKIGCTISPNVFVISGAVTHNRLEFIKYLHNRFCIKLSDSNELEIAIKKDNLEMVKYLYENCYDKIEYDSGNGCCRMPKEHIITVSIKHNRIDIFKYLHQFFKNTHNISDDVMNYGTDELKKCYELMIA